MKGITMQIRENLEADQLAGIITLTGMAVAAIIVASVQTYRLETVQMELRKEKFLSNVFSRAFVKSFVKIDGSDINPVMDEIIEDIKFESIALNIDLDKK